MKTAYTSILLMSTLLCFTALPMQNSQENMQNADLEADCEQSKAQSTFDKMNNDEQKSVLQFCLENEPIAKAISEIGTLRTVSKKFQKFFSSNELLKKAFLRCTFPDEYNDCQKKCLASYLAYITSETPLKNISEADATFINLIQNKNELVALLEERLKSVISQDKTISLEEANEGLINFLLYFGLSENIEPTIFQNVFMTLIELPNTYPKGLVADRLYIINILRDRWDKNTIESQSTEIMFTVYEKIFCVDSETGILDATSYINHKNKFRLNNPATGGKKLITSLVESFSLDKKNEQLLLHAHEGDTKKIQDALQSGACTYDPFIIHLALIFTLSASHKECALLLFNNLPRVIISTQDHLVNNMGPIMESFQFAVKEEFYDIAQSLINHMKNMKIEGDSLKLNMMSMGSYLGMISRGITISKSREFYKKLLTPIFLKDFNIDLPGYDDDLIGEPLRKWLLACCDNYQEVITDRDLLDQINHNLNNLTLLLIFKPMILRMAEESQLEFFKNMTLLPGYKKLLLEMRSTLLTIVRKNQSDMIEEILPKPTN